MTKNRIMALIVLVLITIISIMLWENPQKSNNDNNESTEESLAIMVFDKNQNKYVKSDTFPIGNYKLSSDSYCTNGTPIGTYDNKTGTMTTSFNKSDKCYYYFEKLLITTVSIINNPNGNDYTYCKLEISKDEGKTYQTINYSNITGDTIPLEINSIIRLSNVGCTDCYLKFCENSNCTVSSASDATISVLTYESNKTYVIKGNEAFVSFRANYSGCLIGDTYVYFYDKKRKKKRKKKIKDVNENDLVFIVSEDEISYKKVKKVEKYITYDIVIIYLENGDIIQSTCNHVFVANGLSYVLARELKVNFELKLANGEYVKITKIEKVHYDEGIDVYNLTFDGSKNTCIMIAGSMILSAVLLSIDLTKVLADGSVCAGEAPA